MEFFSFSVRSSWTFLICHAPLALTPTLSLIPCIVILPRISLCVVLTKRKPLPLFLSLFCGLAQWVSEIQGLKKPQTRSRFHQPSNKPPRRKMNTKLQAGGPAPTDCWQRADNPTLGQLCQLRPIRTAAAAAPMVPAPKVPAAELVALELKDHRALRMQKH